jgi:hypothetical protein
MDKKNYTQKHFTDHYIFLQLHSFSAFIIIRIADKSSPIKGSSLK